MVQMGSGPWVVRPEMYSKDVRDARESIYKHGHVVLRCSNGYLSSVLAPPGL